MTYSLEDISVVIVTYKREKDLEITIKSFSKKIKEIKEVIIVDNNPDGKAKKMIDKFSNKKLKYFTSKKNSLTFARNLGVSKTDKKSKIIIFLDDDISLKERYFENIIDVFNKYPVAKGVSGYYFPNKKINKFENILRKIFRIENWTLNKANVLSTFGASYPYKLTKIIKAKWLSGFNMAYKRTILESEKFDERFFKYCLAEDFEFSTRINKKYPESLFITPYAKLIHRTSEAGRTPKPELIYMNLINHLYIQSKNLNNFENILSLYVALLSITSVNIVKFLIKPNDINKIKLKIYFKAITYALRRLGKIRRGFIDLPNKF